MGNTGRIAAVVLALTAAAAPATAKDLRGRFRVTTQTVDSDRGTSDILDQNYQISFRMPVTGRFSYRIVARYEDSDTDDDFSGISFESGRSLAEPLVEIAWTTPVWDFSTGVRYTVQRRRAGDQRERKQQTDWFSRLNWAPMGLPSLSVLYDRIRRRDDAETLSEDDGRLLATLAQIVGPVRWALDFQRRTRDDNLVGLERDDRKYILNADYQDRFASNRVSLKTGVLLHRERLVANALTAVDLERDVVPVAGLFAIDTTPLIDPLPPEPGLVDGDTASPTAVNIGGTAAGGGTDRNIGLDFDQDAPIDGIQVWVDGTLPPISVSRFSWALYTSGDNLNWTLVDPFVPFTFDDVFNRFELRFNQVAARFVKVVDTNHDPGLGSVFVTEMTAVTTESLIGEDRRLLTVRNASATVSYTPTTRWDFGSSTFVGSNRTDEEAGITGEDRLDQSLSALYRPPAKISTSALVRWRVRDRDLGQDEDDFSWTVGVASTPVQNLDLALSYSPRQENEDGREDLEVRSWQFRTAAQLLADLNVSLDLGVNNTLDFEREQQTRKRTARVLLFTRPRRDFTFSSDLLLDRSTFRGPLVIGDGRSDQTTWTNRFVYRPSSAVNLVAEIRYEDLPVGSGVAKRINLDWLPFPGGSLQFSVSYLTDSQAVVGGGRDQLRSTVRWDVRRGVILEVNYFRTERGDGGLDLETETLSALLEIRF